MSSRAIEEPVGERNTSRKTGARYISICRFPGARATTSAPSLAAACILQLAVIRAALETQRSIDRTYLIELKDSSGTVCATVEKLIYIRKR